jgi:hypothetical protein
MADQIFPAGVRMFKKSDKSPEWVVASMVINIDEFIEWLQFQTADYRTKYNDADQIRLQVAFGKSGNPYVAVDTFKKSEPELEEGITPSQETKDRVAAAKASKPPTQAYVKDEEDKLPF